jgi:hypothetical protein
VSSKKYKDKLCVYCSQRKSTAGDHIFSREFFVPSQRGNLPQTPSCEQCNNDKSKIEHYLTAVLPFGGRHADAHENLTALVPGRLANNARLHHHLDKTKSRVWSLESGIYQPTMAVSINPEAIEHLFAFITRGLVWYHWKAYFADEHEIQVFILTDVGRQFFEQHLFSMNAAQRVQVNLGNGTVRYEGIQGVDCQQITVWRFDMYGEVVLRGDPKAPNETCRQIGVLTGPRRTFHMAELRHRFGIRPNEPFQPTPGSDFVLSHFSSRRG